MTRGDDKHSGAELAFYILRPIVSSILILLGGLLISLFVPRLYDTIYRVKTIFLSKIIVTLSFSFHLFVFHHIVYQNKKEIMSMQKIVQESA